MILGGLFVCCLFFFCLVVLLRKKCFTIKFDGFDSEFKNGPFHQFIFEQN